jgi:hypothetical protein
MRPRRRANWLRALGPRISIKWWLARLGRPGDYAFVLPPFTVAVGGNEFHGDFAFLFEREGDTWKIRLNIFSRLATPAGKAGSTTPAADTQRSR